MWTAFQIVPVGLGKGTILLSRISYTYCYNFGCFLFDYFLKLRDLENGTNVLMRLLCGNGMRLLDGKYHRC